MKVVEMRVGLGDVTDATWPALVEIDEHGQPYRWNGFIAAPWFDRETANEIVEYCTPLTGDSDTAVLRWNGDTIEEWQDGKVVHVSEPILGGEWLGTRWPIGGSAWTWFEVKPVQELDPHDNEFVGEVTLRPTAAAANEAMILEAIARMPHFVRQRRTPDILASIDAATAELGFHLRTHEPRSARQTIRMLRIYLDELDGRAAAQPGGEPAPTVRRVE